ncbi:OmpA family protein [Nibribacter ruber]|uniref:OmpA family protein n=1 Tax=Nibribacter ruber TaxID=2698458 RepID=A0A6P1NYZ4_9BACT|nr:OmpA family protein [Nibribacter ruber]QHL88240.1 OmpA family protein [Nibribacter ruber]
MMRHYKTLGALALLVALNGCGPFKSSLSKGDKDFKQGEYQLAIEHYQAALKNSRNARTANFKLAEAYRLSNRLPQAEPFYKAAIDAGQKSEETLFRYGMALKAVGRYEEAAAQLQQYLAVAANKTFIAIASREVENLKQVPAILNTPTYQVIEPFKAANTAASDFGPVVHQGQLMFASTRETQVYKGNGEGFQDLYVVTQNDTTGSAVSFGEPVNSVGIHEATPTFTNEGRTMIFARSNSGKKKGRQDVDLFVSQFKTGKWSDPTILSFNDDAAWDATPAFSPDGKTLYFSSDRRGGQGGNDIWSATLDEGGRFSRPVNLGAPINTPGNESFPHVAPDGTLYIASDGHPGLGGLDLFRINGDSIINLGAPLNTVGDDFAIFYIDKDRGYFSSNRAGGQGGDDIYGFEKRQPKLVNFFVDGRVVERNDKTNATTAMGNIRVTLQNAQGQKVAETVSTAGGAFSFKLDTASVYSVLAEREGYFAARQSVITQGKTPPQSQLTQPLTEIRLTTTLTLTKIVKNKAIVVENIFYDFDKANIRPDAAIELDKLVQTLVDNPKITIELSSHTDSRGNDLYNQDLSQRRAQSAVDYIISKGIDKNRITAKGYGESRPVVKNAKTEAEHQRNRRTEFKVTRIDE